MVKMEGLDRDALARFAAECGERLIGDREWDVVAAVEYPAVAPLIEQLNPPAYQAISPIQDAALERSVLYVTHPMELG